MTKLFLSLFFLISKRDLDFPLDGARQTTSGKKCLDNIKVNCWFRSKVTRAVPRSYYVHTFQRVHLKCTSGVIGEGQDLIAKAKAGRSLGGPCVRLLPG